MTEARYTEAEIREAWPSDLARPCLGNLLGNLSVLRAAAPSPAEPEPATGCGHYDETHTYERCVAGQVAAGAAPPVQPAACTCPDGSAFYGHEQGCPYLAPPAAQREADTAAGWREEARLAYVNIEYWRERAEKLTVDLAAAKAEAFEHREARAELNERCTQYRERVEAAEAELANIRELMVALDADTATAEAKLAAVRALCDKETPAGWSAIRAFVYVNDLRAVLDGPTP